MLPMHLPRVRFPAGALLLPPISSDLTPLFSSDTPRLFWYHYSPGTPCFGTGTLSSSQVLHVLVPLFYLHCGYRLPPGTRHSGTTTLSSSQVLHVLVPLLYLHRCPLVRSAEYDPLYVSDSDDPGDLAARGCAPSHSRHRTGRSGPRPAHFRAGFHGVREYQVRAVDSRFVVLPLAVRADRVVPVLSADSGRQILSHKQPHQLCGYERLLRAGG